VKSLLVIFAISLSMAAVTPAWSQTPAPSSPPSSSAAAVDQDNEPAPVGSKRAECRASTQSLKGQDRRDQMQLCVAQARLDCLKQAIDKKVVGRDERQQYVKTCVGGEQL
jgi:TolA-binding protein